MIKLLGPLVRHSCFNFESPHNYFKELARKQNFKNLAKSLAEQCQLKECGNFGDSMEDAKSHPLFSSERKYGSLSLAEESARMHLREKMDSFGWNVTRYPDQECIQSNTSCLSWYRLSEEWSDHA